MIAWLITSRVIIQIINLVQIKLPPTWIISHYGLLWRLFFMYCFSISIPAKASANYFPAQVRIHWFSRWPLAELPFLFLEKSVVVLALEYFNLREVLGRIKIGLKSKQYSLTGSATTPGNRLISSLCIRDMISGMNILRMDNFKYRVRGYR